MIYGFEVGGDSRLISDRDRHITREGRIVEEELVYVVGYVPRRIRHCHIYLDRLTEAHLHQNVVIQTHQLISHVVVAVDVILGEDVLLVGVRLHLLPQYGSDVASSCVVDVRLQIDGLVLGYAVDKAETEDLHLEELGLRLLMTEVVREVVLVMRLGTVRDAHPVEEIFNWIAREARGDDGTVARLAVLVALEAGARIHVGVLTEGAVRSANRLSHDHVVVGDRVGILLSCNCRALWQTGAHEELRGGVRANHAIGLQGAIANLARRMATDGSHLDVVDLLCFQIGEVCIIISNTS